MSELVSLFKRMQEAQLDDTNQEVPVSLLCLNRIRQVGIYANLRLLENPFFRGWGGGVTQYLNSLSTYAKPPLKLTLYSVRQSNMAVS